MVCPGIVYGSVSTPHLESPCRRYQAAHYLTAASLVRLLNRKHVCPNGKAGQPKQATHTQKELHHSSLKHCQENSWCPKSLVNKINVVSSAPWKVRNCSGLSGILSCGIRKVIAVTYTAAIYHHRFITTGQKSNELSNKGFCMRTTWLVKEWQFILSIMNRTEF